MLVQFSVENYLSFGEETTLSMLPAKSRKQKDHIIHCTKGKSVSVLPLAAFYGANASGKSNFVKAVDFFRTLILGEIDTIKSIPVSLFKLNAVPEDFLTIHPDDSPGIKRLKRLASLDTTELEKFQEELKAKKL